MTTIDPTDAVEAAARDRAGTSRGEGAYDRLPRIVQHHLREVVHPIVSAAAPAIEAAVRAQIAAELDAIAQQYRATSEDMGRVIRAREPRDFGMDDVIRYYALASAWEAAAKRARDDS